MFKKLFNKFFDYKIVGEYYDTSGDGIYKKKYHKKYFLRKEYTLPHLKIFKRFWGLLGGT